MTENEKQHPRAILESWGLRPKKKYGQNFLMDGGAAHRIARLSLSGAPPHTRIIEIGAGTGALTLALLDEGADVTAIEIDPELIGVLKNRSELSAATIVQADAMQFDFASFAQSGPWRVSGNLPYNVATPLITSLCEMENGPETITVMIQKDVADRLAARPGTPAYGSLSIAVQYSMETERAFTLGPRAFYPAPKVDSTVIQLRRRLEPAVRPRSVERFRALVRAGFAYRRKTLANSVMLALGFDRTAIQRALSQCNLDESVRGEQLSMQAFSDLSDALEQVSERSGA